MKKTKAPKYSIITLFPEAIKPYLDASIIGRAQADKKIKITYHNPRDYSEDKHARVDRRPYGGGPGMVLAPEPYLRAASKALGKKTLGKKTLTIFFTPAGAQFDQVMAKKLAGYDHLLFITGHYEGVDGRVAKILKAKEVSIGPYVLTGGELPAATMIDAIVRNIPTVLGKEESREDERVASPEVYTRPEILEWKGKKYRVPKVLLGGNHKLIDEWRLQQQEKRRL